MMFLEEISEMVFLAFSYQTVKNIFVVFISIEPKFIFCLHEFFIV